MINHLRHLAVFARVVENGSFRAAAKSIGIAPSRVSETVSDLEDHLGATLLYRTTRKIALTNEGRVLYARVADMLRSAETGLNELNALSLEPAGALRISVPAFMSSSWLSTVIADFIRQHPHVAMTVSYSDYPVGLLEDGFDINIRAGWPDDSATMQRKLQSIDRVLVAGRDYAASRPPPTHAKDLQDWDWIWYKQRSDTAELVDPSGQVFEVKGRSQIQVDSADALYHFVCQNIGVTILPLHLAERGEKSGTLVRLLPDWSLSPLGVYAMWSDKSRRENLTLTFIRFLANHRR
ncbi:LysR family transcriptional regulator [Yoonia sp. I 8.24]|uniref:LysR family transcriptional regulator n=1 Tax=Yoonia sp. I 8.24 TaxID=1537229 RepID=UPI001EE008BB|nr:LysR family transcriptional regulator [Yoonia sp. I 8.24]MCG3268528.1 LysR family transcriptional regulator [Yoonia sp. I 8.24]